MASTLSIDSDSKTLLSIENVSINPWGTGGSYEGTLMGGGFEVEVEGAKDVDVSQISN